MHSGRKLLSPLQQVPCNLQPGPIRVPARPSHRWAEALTSQETTACSLPSTSPSACCASFLRRQRRRVRRWPTTLANPAYTPPGASTKTPKVCSCSLTFDSKVHGCLIIWLIWFFTSGSDICVYLLELPWRDCRRHWTRMACYTRLTWVGLQ